MPIDIQSESLISMAQVGARIPGRPSACTIWRWATRGIRGRVLETIILGGRRYTSVQALQRFGVQGRQVDGPGIRTPAVRQKAIQRAEHELRALGI